MQAHVGMLTSISAYVKIIPPLQFIYLEQVFFCPFGSLRNLSLCHQPAVMAQDRSSADGGWAALWKLAG